MAGESTESPVDGIAMLSYLPEGSEDELMGTGDTIVDRLQFLTRAAPGQVDVGARKRNAYVFGPRGASFIPARLRFPRRILHYRNYNGFLESSCSKPTR